MIIFLPEEEADKRLLLSYNLRDLMREKGFSRTSLARMIGKPISVINSYIECSKYPDDNMMYTLAGALGCKVDDLIDDSSIPWRMGRSREEIENLEERI